MEHINDTVNKIKIGLTQVANGIEAVANQPAPKPEFANNEISGDKVHGGVISHRRGTEAVVSLLRRLVLAGWAVSPAARRLSFQRPGGTRLTRPC